MNDEKLQKLAEIEGYDDPMDMMEDYVYDGSVPAICKNPDCDYSEHMEPDQDRGWCVECEENTVVSAMIMMGLI